MVVPSFAVVMGKDASEEDAVVAETEPEEE